MVLVIKKEKNLNVSLSFLSLSPFNSNNYYATLISTLKAMFITPTKSAAGD